METLNLNKKNGEILSSGEWNRIISALNALINYYNNFPDKISAFDNDTGYLTDSNILGLASEQYVRDAIQALVDSGVMAGPKGEDGITPYINQTNKHWIIGNTDTGIVAEGIDGISPTVTVLEILGGHSVTISDASNSYTFNVLNGAEGLPGVDGITPHIDPTTKHWMIGETDTNILAEGQNGQNGLDGNDGNDGTNGNDGITPHIDPTTGNWFIGSNNTGVHAQGQAGQNGKSVYQSYLDTTSDDPVLSEADWIESLKGANGQDGTNGTNGLNGQPGADGVTPHIDSATKHWMIGTTDTGIVAEGQNGTDGTNGTNGSDGITPTVTITPITGGNTISFNYGANDPRNTSFNVMNGTASSLSLVLANWNETDSSSAAYIQNKPSLFSGNYADLSNKPTIPNEVTEQTVSGWGFTKNSANYTDLYEKPSIPSMSNGFEYVDLGLPSGTLWEKNSLNSRVNPEFLVGNNFYYSGTMLEYLADNSLFRLLNIDFANLVLGGSWHMPTKKLYEELIANTTTSIILTNVTNLRCVRFTSNSDNTKYIDFCYYYFESNQYRTHNFMSITPSSNNPGNYYCMKLTYSNNDTIVTPTIDSCYITWLSDRSTYNNQVYTRGVLDSKPYISKIPSNETAVSGGNTLSVVTTGDKYNWNNKASIWSGTQVQYDALSPNYDSNTIYIITAS